jgi:hypothetical protein
MGSCDKISAAVDSMAYILPLTLSLSGHLGFVTAHFRDNASTALAVVMAVGRLPPLP